MKLPDVRNLSGGSLSNLRNVADGMDHTLVRLIVIGLLPFVACLIILFSQQVLTKLVTDSLLTAVILWAVGGATYAGFQYLEDWRTEEHRSVAGVLSEVGVIVLAGLAAPILIYWVSQITR